MGFLDQLQCEAYGLTGGRYGGGRRDIAAGQGEEQYSWRLGVWGHERTRIPRVLLSRPLPVELGVADVMALISECHLTPSVAPSLQVLILLNCEGNSGISRGIALD